MGRGGRCTVLQRDLFSVYMGCAFFIFNKNASSAELSIASGGGHRYEEPRTDARRVREGCGFSFRMGVLHTEARQHWGNRGLGYKMIVR